MKRVPGNNGRDTMRRAGDNARLYYVVGKSLVDSTRNVLAVASRAPFGWRVRSTEREYNHDYVCHESFDTLMDWLHFDMDDAFLCCSRQEVMTLLTSGDTPTGFLLPNCDARAQTYGEADRVLRHLESAWAVARPPPSPR